MKNKKLSLSKKTISNLNKIHGGNEINPTTGPGLSRIPDGQSECLCGPTTDPTNNTISCDSCNRSCNGISCSPRLCPVDTLLNGC